MRQFKFAKNVVGDCILSMRPENLKMNMFWGPTLKKSKLISGILRCVLTFLDPKILIHFSGFSLELHNNFYCGTMHIYHQIHLRLIFV